MALQKICRVISFCSLFFISFNSSAQMMSARSVLEDAAEAMGGLDRIQSVDSLLMTGFSQILAQDGAFPASPHPKAPGKWMAQNGVERYFDINDLSAYQTHRQGLLSPLALEVGHNWAPVSQLQEGVSALNHPLTALRAALANNTDLGSVSIEDDNIVVQFTLADGATLWLGVNQFNKIPSWVRWLSPHNNLGEVTYTTWFTGYVPFDGIRLPSGFATEIDWRDIVLAVFHVDSYEIDVDLPEFPTSGGNVDTGDPIVDVTEVADGVWDVRVGENGGAVVEFEDHLLMFEAYGNEADSFARIDRANTLVPGKEVTQVILSHHHFDHSSGIRAAVSRGLTIITKRENEGIVREMVSRPAPNFPDALARNPQPLDFFPVDEHLILEDAMRRVDVYEVIGNMHMTDAIFAYLPQERIFMQGDMFDIRWDYQWWGGNYMDSIEHFDLDLPVTDIPVHGRVTTFEEVMSNISMQVEGARALCARNESVGIYMAGCPVKYSRD